MIIIITAMNTAMKTRTRLRAFLESRGVRFSWVAQQVGLTDSHFNRVMDGTRPMTAPVAEKLFELYGIDFREEASDGEA